MITEQERASLMLHSAIALINKTMQEAGLAGACMLISPDEAAFTYNFAAPWSAFEADPAAQFGFRFALNAKRDGVAETLGRAQATAHIVCQLDDFGTQTRFWMADMKKMLADNGVDFHHTQRCNAAPHRQSLRHPQPIPSRTPPMSNLTVLQTGPRAASDLSSKLRELADAVDRGDIVQLILGCVRNDEYELMFSAPLDGSLVLAALLHRSAVDKFRV